MASTVKIRRELERMIAALEGQLLRVQILASSVESILSVVTTPLTCGDQASVAISSRKGRCGT